ncbi:MAG: phosphoglycerate mutase [Sulfuriferula sp.]
MDITLFIPDLIPVAEMRLALLGDLALPALETLLARAQRQQIDADGNMETALCEYFGIPRQLDWPIAPITLLADGGDPAEYFWLRADPVHLRATREQLMLVDSGAFNISQNEAEQIALAFNRHFQTDGYVLYPLHPKRWYLHVSRPPALTTSSINTAAGKNIQAYLPQGADSLAWHRFYNEIQMLFFNLPVNEQREARGELPINSLWCWGGGTMPIVKPANETKLWANDSVALAFAAASGAAKDNLPDNANAIAQPALVILDSLSGAAQYADYQGWREALLQLEEHWFAPLLEQLKSGKLASLEISTFAQRYTINWQIKRTGLYKLWRRATVAQSLSMPTL